MAQARRQLWKKPNESWENLIRNPSFETNSDFWGTDGVLTLARSDEWAYSGGWSLKWSNYVSSTTNFYYLDGGSAGVVNGQTYTWSMVLRRAGGGTVSATQIQLVAFDGVSVNGYPLSTTFEALGGGAWRATQTFTATGTSGAILLGAYILAGVTGETWYIDSVVMVQPPFKPPIFDGDSPGSYWTGTPHASTSILIR